MDTNLDEVAISREQLIENLIKSDSYEMGGLCIDKFLDEDMTIDLEKLELAISLLIEYLEISVKSENPIYVILRNMDLYFMRRKLSPEKLDQIIEESSFILGFCQSIADEESLSKKVIIKFAGVNDYA